MSDRETFVRTYSHRKTESRIVPCMEGRTGLLELFKSKYELEGWELANMSDFTMLLMRDLPKPIGIWDRMKISPSVTGICLGSILVGLFIFLREGGHPMNQIQVLMHGIKEDPSFLILMACVFAMLILSRKPLHFGKPRIDQ